MTERVTVTTPRGRAGRPPHRRCHGAWAGPDTGPVRSLMRAQARLAVATCAVVALVTGGLPVLFACQTGLSRIRLFGVRVPWLIMCAAVPLVWVAAARRHVRLAERIERDFTERALAGQGPAGPGYAEPGLAGPGYARPDFAGGGVTEPDNDAPGLGGDGLAGQRSAEDKPAEAARSE